MRKLLTLVAFMVATVAALAAYHVSQRTADTPSGDATTVPEGTVVGEDGYKPANQPFGFDFTIDWETQHFEASIDLTTCGSYTQNENILTVGNDISKWKPTVQPGACLHLYYTKYSKHLGVHYLYNESGATSDRIDAELDNVEDTASIKVSKTDGLVVNGTTLLTADQLTTLFSLTDLTAGSKEGNTRSQATYEYMRVVDDSVTPDPDPEPTPVITIPEGTVVGTDDFAATGEGFTWTTGINWDKQHIKAYIDLSTCEDGSENILSLGHETSSWNATESDGQVVHIYYKKGDNKKLNFYVCTPTSSYDAEREVKPFEADSAVVEISKAAGLTINGEVFATPDQLTDILAMTDIELSDAEGGQQLSHATYKYVRLITDVVDPDPDPEPKPTYPEGTVVGTDDFAATGEGFTYTTPVEWGKQYVKMLIDLSTCGDGSENVFSIGTDNTSEWYAPTADGQIIHVYYKKGENKKMNLYVCTQGNDRYIDPVEVKPYEATQMEVELSQENGLVINGETYATADQLSLIFAKNSLEISDEQGSNSTMDQHSHATYKYIRVIDLEQPVQPVQPVATQTYTDLFAGTSPTLGKADQSMQKLVIDTYEGDSITVTLKDVTIGTTALGDITFPVTVDETGVFSSEDAEATVGTGTATVTFQGHEYTDTEAETDRFYATISISGTGADDATYTFEGVYGVEPPSAVTTYTDSLVTTYKDQTGTYQNKQLTITEYASGKYDLRLDALNFVTSGDLSMGNLLITGVTGTKDDKGNLTIEATDPEMRIENGQSADLMSYSPATVKVLVRDGKAYLHFEGTTVRQQNSVIMDFGTNPVYPGTVVGEDGYAPEGASFTWSTDIDWDKQYLEAVIDLTTCKSTTSYENVISVGGDIEAWPSTDGAFQLYYTKSSESLQVNYLSSTNTTNKNIVRTDIAGIADTVTIAISKKEGITVNGTPYNIINGSGTQTTDIEGTYPELFGMTNINVGSVQGNTRSWATYLHVRVLDLPETPAVPVVYTDEAKTTYSDATNTFADQTVEITAEKEGTYTVVFRQLPVGNLVIGDYTATGVTATESEDGYLVYSFDGEATVTNVDASVSSMNLMTEGQTVPLSITGKSKDGKLYAVFTTTINNNPLVAVFGTDPDAPEEGVTTYTDKLSTSLNGQENTYADRTLTVTDKGEGKYDLSVSGIRFLSSGDTDMGTLVLTGVDGTLTEDGDTIFTATGMTGVLEGCPSTSLKDLKELTVNGRIHNGKAYLRVEGLTTNYELTFIAIFGTNTPTAISGIEAIAEGATEIYTLGGVRVSTLQRGINIVRTADGKTVKVLKK